MPRKRTLKSLLMPSTTKAENSTEFSAFACKRSYGFYKYYLYNSKLVNIFAS